MLLFFYIKAAYLSVRLQTGRIDGVRSENVRVASSVPQDSVLGSLLKLVHTSDLPNNLDA